VLEELLIDVAADRFTLYCYDDPWWVITVGDRAGRRRRAEWDTARRLRHGLTTRLNAGEVFWHPRSEAARDVHRGVLGSAGTVSAICGVQFRPQGPPMCPPDPQRICLACCRLIPW
jgi:hypothetical protein